MLYDLFGVVDGWNVLFDNQDTEPEPSYDYDISLDYARCFQSPAGQAVLNHLDQITRQRVTSPNQSDSALWYLEGQRYLVQTIHQLMTRGQNLPSTYNKS